MPLKTATYLGNPAAAKDVFARNVWDLHAYDGQILIGTGDTGLDSHPTLLYYWDPDTQQFGNHGSTDGESLQTFLLIGSTIFLPEFDPTGRPDPGYYYTWDGSTLASHSMPSGAMIHSPGMAHFNNNLYVTTYRETGSQNIYRWPDGGSAWVGVGSPALTIPLVFLEVNGSLYAFDGVAGTCDRLNSNDTRTSFAVVDFFPNGDDFNSWPFLSVSLDGTTTVYLRLGVDLYQTPGGLYKSTGPGSSTTLTSALSSGHGARDLLIRDGTVYVLSTKDNGDGTWESRVSTFNGGLTALTEVFHIVTATFARSFEELDNIWYFGLGTNLGSTGSGTPHADTGKIYSVDLRTVPDAPTIGTATATGSDTTTVAFTAPASDGGASITGYVATSTPGSHTGGGASSPITVGGLSSETAYTFTVHATNAIGDSAESSASNSATTESGEETVTGGPIFPCSAYPVSVDVFPNTHVGAGATSKHDDGLGVAASLGSDAIWRLRFQMPPGTLPTGTCQLRLLALANATSGNAKVNPKWASIAPEESPSGATLNAEGVQTLTWASGDNDQYKEVTVTLDADTPVAGEIIAMDLTFETASFTLAQVSTWIPCIRWV